MWIYELPGKKKPYVRKNEPYYHSTAWRKLRDAFLRINTRCCLCGAVATVADHKVQRINGGADSFDNLRPLCKPCHDVHTARQGQKAQSENRKKEQRGGVMSKQIANQYNQPVDRFLFA